MPVTRTQVDGWYKKYGAAVLRRARAILGCESLAQEAVQEIFVQVLRRGAFQASASPMTWLYRITTHHCIDQLRRSKRDRDWRSQALAPATRSEGAEENLVLMRQILAHADEREAAAAIYVFVDELTYEEAAPLLGVSKRTVGNLVMRFVAGARLYTSKSSSPAYTLLEARWDKGIRP